MEPLQVIKNVFEEQEIQGSLDVRVTMTHKGIKVNFGMGTDSNKPTTFDLKESILISAIASAAEIQKWMKRNTKDEESSDLLWYYTKRLKFFNTIIERLSPKPMTPEVDQRIPGVGC